MYILMDLVVNHCSDEHEWFRKACEDPEGKYGNFFYLRDKKEGELPTNWRSYFGGPVWEDLPGTNKQYLHVFHKKQPDLNWENPELREEVYKNINWWLDKGLGGFRIDAIMNIKKALPFRDYEPDREDGLSSIQNMLHEASGIGEFLGEMRDRTFKKYDAFSVGEVFDEKPEEIPDFIGENGYFSSMFDFNETIFGQSSKDGTMLPRSCRMIIKSAVSRHRPGSAASVFCPTLLRIMTNPVESAVIFLRASAASKARKCWRR